VIAFRGDPQPVGVGLAGLRVRGYDCEQQGDRGEEAR
jgi:hypothetical protein